MPFVAFNQRGWIPLLGPTGFTFSPPLFGLVSDSGAENEAPIFGIWE